MSDQGENVELVSKELKELNLKKYLSDPCLIGLSRHIIDLEDCGPISVYVQGDLEKMRDGPVIMTIHDLGSSYHSMVEFANHIDMDEIKHRCLILHISIFGQSHKAPDLPHAFPSMDKLGLNLITILDQLKIKTAVVMGDGAGANLALRFGMNHPTRTSGLVLLNCTAAESNLSVMEKIFEALTGTGFSAGPDEPQLNQKNIALYADAFKKRTSISDDITKKVKYDVLMINGGYHGVYEESLDIYSKIQPGKASIIKIDEVYYPLKEIPEKVADPLILFLQGLGWIPTARRKCSKTSLSNQSSVDESNERPQLTRRISMEQYDVPNIRKYSREEPTH